MGKARSVIASDGLRARENRAYARAKLDYMRRYLIRGLAVAGRKPQRVYVDLFAGPGLNVDKRTRDEFQSGALEALQLTGDDSLGAPFTDAYLVNLDPGDHAALEARIERLNAAGKLRVARPRIHTIPADANVALPWIMQQIDPRAFVFVFADLEGISQFPFTSVQALRHTKNHQSVDLYVLLPLQMDINRNLPYEGPIEPSVIDNMDAFFGTDRWREAHRRHRITPAQGRELRKALEDIYLEQLRTIWTAASCVQRVHLEGQRALYHMLLATSHPAAQRLAQGVARATERDTGQMRLFSD